MQKTLSVTTVDRTFPEGTADPGFTFTVTGTLVDGSPFEQVVVAGEPTVTMDLAPGTYTAGASKLGFTSLPSDPFTVEAPATVTLSVPDDAQKVVVS